MMLEQISGVRIPDSKIAREVTEFIRDAESDLLFHHSVRVYVWGALTGTRMKLRFEPELLYTAAMFHDIGLTTRYADSKLRFEVDGANAARDFLRGHGVSERDIEMVWNAVALHTTPGIPEFMRPEIALVQAGAGMDVAGRGYDQFTDEQRQAVIAAFPRETDFKHGIIDAFYQGMKHRPDSTLPSVHSTMTSWRSRIRIFGGSICAASSLLQTGIAELGPVNTNTAPQ